MDTPYNTLAPVSSGHVVPISLGLTLLIVGAAGLVTLLVLSVLLWYTSGGEHR